MNYSNDCGCAPAPKAMKTVSVQPMAPVEEITCPDARCLPHLLNSLPETDDAVPNYVGVYKGKSYIAPIRALVDSVLLASMNAAYRENLVPAVSDARDVESLPVVQKGNCSKMGVAPMPVIAEAMMSALPVAPVGYSVDKIMTTDKDGGVYLETPVNIVGDAIVPAIEKECAANRLENIPLIEKLLGFGAKCSEFGYATISQLQDALIKNLKLAEPKTLPIFLRGFDGPDSEKKYPVTVSRLVAQSQTVPLNGNLTAVAPLSRISGQAMTLQPGVWAVSVTFVSTIVPGAGVVAGQQVGYNAFVEVGGSIRYGSPTANANPTPTNNLFLTTTVTRFIRVTVATPILVYVESTGQGPLNFAGRAEVDVLQFAELNLGMNGVL